ncbi:MAG: PilZ domain-containing protein [Polyangia bacterium]
MIFTFPDLPACPEGLEAGRAAVVRYTSRMGCHVGRTSILRVANGPPVTAALQRLVKVETAQRRRYPRVSVRLPAALATGSESGREAGRPGDERARIRNLGAGGMLLETSLPVMAGDEVNLTVPGPDGTVARRARHIIGKVLRVEKHAGGKRKALVAGVEISFTSDEERDAWAQLVLALQRKGK